VDIFDVFLRLMYRLDTAIFRWPMAR